MTPDDYLESIQRLTFRHQTIDVSIIEFIINSVVRAARKHELERFLVEHNPEIVLVCENRQHCNHRHSFLNLHLSRTDTTLINNHTFYLRQY